MRDRMTAVLVAIVLAASSAAAAQDATATLRIWNSDVLKVDDVRQAPDQTAPLRPISIIGVRNGWFSGKAVAGSSGPIKGLRTEISDLKSESGTIPATHVRIRYGVPWRGMDSRYDPAGMDILLASPPEDRSIISVWVTVKVPKESRPGTYRGRLTVQAAEGKAVPVPVELKVMDWTLPDTGEWQTWVELVESPDTLAAEYDVPLWSDSHWQLIAQSFELIGEIGSRVVYVPLICHTNHGNEQSMVRWIAQGEDGYDHDFSIMDKYLDVATEHMGRPKIVVLNAWDAYLSTPAGEIIPDEEVTDRRAHKMSFKHMEDARRALRGKGPVVTLVDSEGGDPRMLNLPRYEDPDSREFWRPVWSQLRQRLKKRGLEDAMMIGMFTDDWPQKQEIDALHDLSGGLPWVCHAHWSATQRGRSKLYGVASVGYESTVWDTVVTLNPAKDRTYGWKRPEFVVAHYRKMGVNRMTPSRIRCLAETNITGGQRGVGRIGGDFWWAIKDKRGRRAGTVTDRYPQSMWRNLDIKASLLAPGPSGPVATVRYEYLREGVQECEARILIERALTDDILREKLGAELATRCQTLLDERQLCLWRAQGLSEETIQSHGSVRNPTRSVTRGSNSRNARVAGHTWFLNSGWQERTEKLFALAGEVAAKL